MITVKVLLIVGTHFRGLGENDDVGDFERGCLTLFKERFHFLGISVQNLMYV